MKWYRNLIFAVALLAPATLWAQAPRYTIDSSRQPSGASIGGINNNGEISGTLAGGGGYYTQNGVVQTFAVPAPGQQSSFAFGKLNNVGQVLGSSHTVLTNIYDSASLYTNGVGRTLNLDTNTFANDLNDQGVVVGTTSSYWDGTPRKAYSWQNGTVKYLGTLSTNSPNSAESVATAVNNSGVVAGYSTANDGRFHAFVYQNGVMQEIGPARTGAFGINDLGQIVGGWNDMGPRSSAFLYSNGTYVEFGTAGSRALDINNQGQVIGENYGATSSTATPFYYANGTMNNLQSMLVNPSGWTLQHVSNINDLGQITGYGQYNGEMTYFVATPVPVPEPAGIALGLGGMLTLAMWRLARRRSNWARIRLSR